MEEGGAGDGLVYTVSACNGVSDIIVDGNNISMLLLDLPTLSESYVNNHNVLSNTNARLSGYSYNIS